MNLSQESIEKIIVGVVTAIVILILSEPIKAAFRKIGEWLEKFIQALGFGVTKRYYTALTFNRENLKLIGAYEDRERPPKLENVYISLKLDSEGDARQDLRVLRELGGLLARNALRSRTQAEAKTGEIARSRPG